MRQRLLRRVSAILGGGAFALAVAGPMQWDSCPVHGVMAHGQTGAPLGTHTMVAHRHVLADAAAAPSHHAPGKQDGTHHCTCPDCCCCSAPVVHGPGTPLTQLDIAVLVVDRIAPSTTTVALSASAQVVLPFPNGPPTDRS